MGWLAGILLGVDVISRLDGVKKHITRPECRSFADNEINNILIDLASNLLDLRSRLIVCKAKASTHESCAGVHAWW